MELGTAAAYRGNVRTDPAVMDASGDLAIRPPDGRPQGMNARDARAPNAGCDRVLSESYAGSILEGER